MRATRRMRRLRALREAPRLHRRLMRDVISVLAKKMADDVDAAIYGRRGVTLEVKRALTVEDLERASQKKDAYLAYMLKHGFEFERRSADDRNRAFLLGAQWPVA